MGDVHPRDVLGGVRIRFYSLPTGTEVSALGVPSGDGLVPFRSGGEALGPLVRAGRLDGRTWIASLERDGRWLRGVFRFLVVIALAVGSGLLASRLRRRNAA